MKKKLLTLIVFVVFSLGFSYAQNNLKHPIVGAWGYVSAKINGNNDARSEKISRTQHFFADGSFESRYLMAGGIPRVFNNGKYFMADDTTLVTLQNNINGKLDSFSNVYTVKIKNDTLHLYGFYIRQVNETAIIPVYLDEYWVKKRGKDGK